VKTPLISSLVGGGGSIKLDPDNREDDPTASLYLIDGEFPVGPRGIVYSMLWSSRSESINIVRRQMVDLAIIDVPTCRVAGCGKIGPQQGR